jgi:hypothetical protein
MTPTMRRATVWLATVTMATACGASSPPPSKDAPLSVTPVGPSAPSTPDLDASSDLGSVHADAPDAEAPGEAWTPLGDVETRAWIRRLGDVRLRPGGPVVATGPGDVEGFEIAALAQQQDHVQVGWTFGQTQLHVWLDADDAAPTVARVEPLANAPKVKVDGDEGRIDLGPGALVESLESRDGWTRVRTVDDGHEGWVPDDALARVYAYRRFEYATAGPVGFVPGRVALRATPGGAKVFTLPRVRPVSPHRVRVLSDADPKWLLVEYVPPCPESVRVTGFAAARDVNRPSPPPGVGISCGYATFRGRRPGLRPPRGTVERVELAAGTKLHDDEGRPVGEVLDPTTVLVVDDDHVGVPSPWGVIPLAR